MRDDPRYEEEMHKTRSILIGIFAAVLLFSIDARAQVPLKERPIKLIVRNAKLFTMASGQRDVFTGYLVVDASGKIVAVGPGEPPASFKAAQTWDAGGHWILPGFLSAHSHLWQAAFRGIAADKTLPGWIDGLYNQKASKAAPEDF